MLPGDARTKSGRIPKIGESASIEMMARFRAYEICGMLLFVDWGYSNMGLHR